MIRYIKFIVLFLFSSLAYATIFNISYKVIDCNSTQTNCTVSVDFTVTGNDDFLYSNSCKDINPRTVDLQYCIEDLEVRASRVYNNQ